MRTGASCRRRRSSVAEETGLIVPVGAVGAGHRLRPARGVAGAAGKREALSISVNDQRAPSSTSPDFVDQVLACVDRHGVDPADLKLELTESVILGVAWAVARMAYLKARGLRASRSTTSAPGIRRCLPQAHAAGSAQDRPFLRPRHARRREQRNHRHAILGMSTSLAIEVVRCCR